MTERSSDNLGIDRAVLLLSAALAGGIARLGPMLAAEGWHVVLVSEVSDDPNSVFCDGHVLVDWARPSGDIVAAVRQYPRHPTAVLTMVEGLLGQRAELIDRLGLPDPSPGLTALTDKAAVRRACDRAGVFSMPWTSGPLQNLADAQPPRWPVVLKPALSSGASRDVRLVGSADELARAVATADDQQRRAPFLIEEFQAGQEFSVDGFVVDGHFEPVLIADKIDQPEDCLRDHGLRVCPPIRALPTAAVAGFVADLRRLLAELGVDRLWLHVEARVQAGQRAILIEANPRPGGGLYPAAIAHHTGVDPLRMSVAMALGDSLPASQRPPRSELVAMVPFDAPALGVVHCMTTVAELVKIPGVIDAYVIDGYRVSSLVKENFFAGVLVVGADEAELRSAAAAAAVALVFQVLPE